MCKSQHCVYVDLLKHVQCVINQWHRFRVTMNISFGKYICLDKDRTRTETHLRK